MVGLSSFLLPRGLCRDLKIARECVCISGDVVDSSPSYYLYMGTGTIGSYKRWSDSPRSEIKITMNLVERVLLAQILLCHPDCVANPLSSSQEACLPQLP